MSTSIYIFKPKLLIYKFKIKNFLMLRSRGIFQNLVESSV